MADLKDSLSEVSTGTNCTENGPAHYHPLSSDFGLPYYSSLIERCRSLATDTNNSTPAGKMIMRLLHAWDCSKIIQPVNADGHISSPLSRQAFHVFATPSRSDLNALELAICDLLPLTELQLRLNRLRSEYLQFGGKSSYDSYVEFWRKKEEKGRTETEDREDARFLTLEVQRFRTGLIAMEEKRRRILWWVLSALLFFTILIVCINYWAIEYAPLKESLKRIILVMRVASAGSVGAIFSYLIRAQQASVFSGQDGDKVSLITVVKKRFYIEWVLSIAIGAIAATTLCALMASELLSGTLFAWHIGQPDANVWLLWIWSFIAGFAERFVPDLLDTFVKRADAVTSSSK